jgi:hypothetical protein
VKLACDIDNVVLEWQQTWADLYAEWFGKLVPAEALQSWNACLEATHFETMDEFYEWFNHAGGWALMPNVPGAMGGLWELQKLKVPFSFCTARPKEGEPSAIRLAEKCSTTVTFLNAKSKHLAMATIWLDDSPEVLVNLVDHKKRAIRFDRPWNRALPKKYESKLLVARDWSDVVEICAAERAAS